MHIAHDTFYSSGFFLGVFLRNWVQLSRHYAQQWFTSVSHTRSWLCYFLLWDRKWRSHPGRGGKWVRDRGRLFIFYPITSQLRVRDTDVNCCCATYIHDYLKEKLFSHFAESFMAIGCPHLDKIMKILIFTHKDILFLKIHLMNSSSVFYRHRNYFIANTNAKIILKDTYIFYELR